jgi:uncharacterized protein (TIGR03067 family)
MRPVLALLLALSIATVAPLPFPKPPDESDLKELQGNWVAVRERSGDEKELSVMKVWFRSDRATFLVSGTVSSYSTIAIDRTKTPRRMTLCRDVGGGALVVQRAAYRVEGDTLYLAFRAAEGDGSFPSDLKGDKRDWLYVCKRKR